METDLYNGFCICVHCNTQIPHPKGEPCREKFCPQCGKRMMRSGSYHHQLHIQKKGEINHEESSSTDQGKCC
jgi:uncharacterized protein